MKNRKSITTQILLIIAVLVVINILSERFFFRLDFTEDGRYTLSKATKDILKQSGRTCYSNCLFYRGTSS